MLQGTGSNVGKSVLAAGILRALANRGYAVRPFKPQNMSNNAAVAADGGEIGRAQALQARAARVPPSVHMNPVLLKPSSDTGAQIVVRGRVAGVARAREFQSVKCRLLPLVMESFGGFARRPIWSSSRAPAAHRRPICGKPTSPIWVSPPPPIFPSL